MDFLRGVVRVPHPHFKGFALQSSASAFFLGRFVTDDNRRPSAENVMLSLLLDEARVRVKLVLSG